MLIAMVFAALLFATVLSVSYLRHSGASSSSCKQTLSALGEAIHMYVQECRDYPLDLETAVKRSDNSRLLLMCPAQGDQLDRAKSGKPSDYGYIYWDKSERGNDWGSGNYPIAFDKSVANHNAEGVNILYENGNIAWDPGAQRLSKALRDKRTWQPVPFEALTGDLEINSWGGIDAIKFPTFKSWLLDGGASAQIQALHDARTLDSAKGIGWVAEKKQVPPLPERLVKDVAYQILCGDREIAIHYNYDRAKRDELIARLLSSRYEEPRE